MSVRIAAHHVGASDPEKRASPPVLDDTDEYHVAQAQQHSAQAGGYCNDSNYRCTAYACTGAELLHGPDSLWLRQVSCGPSNP